jgi:Spy/CpxP family protein refolding chaperone
MLRTISRRLVCWTALISLAVVLGAGEQPLLGAEGSAPVKRAFGRKGRRLPAHDSQVVNEQQREKIYKIQEDYQPKIEALQKQLEALKKERDEKIAAVLTAEQKKQVEEAVTKAKAERKSKGRPATKPAEKPPATPPVAPSSPPTVPVPKQ